MVQVYIWNAVLGIWPQAWRWNIPDSITISLLEYVLMWGLRGESRWKEQDERWGRNLGLIQFDYLTTDSYQYYMVFKYSYIRDRWWNESRYVISDVGRKRSREQSRTKKYIHEGMTSRNAIQSRQWGIGRTHNLSGRAWTSGCVGPKVTVGEGTVRDKLPDRCQRE